MAPDLTLGMLLPMGPRITLFQVVYIGLLHVAWSLSHFFLFFIFDELFLPNDTKFDLPFLTNHICSTLLHVLKTFESL